MAFAHRTGMLLRFSGLVVVVTLTMVLLGCAPRESAQQEHREANTPAGKVGQAAHKVAVEADKAGRAIGRQLGKAAHDAHEGWKEDSQKSRSTQ